VFLLITGASGAGTAEDRILIADEFPLVYQYWDLIER
jgi:hypothetical protein